MNSNLFGLISICTALIATIAGPYVTLKTARKQINANVISTNRVKRIETVRELISSLIAQITTYLAVREFLEKQSQSGEAPNSDLLSRVEAGVRSTTALRLILNPNLPNNQRLVELLEYAVNRLRSKDEQNVVQPDVEASIKEIISLSQTILKSEWNRVKRGD